MNRKQRETEGQIMFRRVKISKQFEMKLYGIEIKEEESFLSFEIRRRLQNQQPFLEGIRRIGES